jgi:hypothetical protein
LATSVARSKLRRGETSVLNDRADQSSEPDEAHRAKLSALKPRDRRLVQSGCVTEPRLGDPGAAAAAAHELGYHGHAAAHRDVVELVIDPSTHVGKHAGRRLRADRPEGDDPHVPPNMTPTGMRRHAALEVSEFAHLRAAPHRGPAHHGFRG